MLAKRFLPLEHYQANEARGYRLLPCRFTALDDRRYVLSNIAGEYVVVDRDAVVALVTHQLSSNCDLYLQLKAKHFLYDEDSNVALDLLALKYRTKLHRIGNFTGLHMFVVTLRCDYTCQYCQVSRQTEDRLAFDMSDEVADRAVEMAFQSPSSTIKIEFQGGEPLLALDRIRRVVKVAEARNDSEHRHLQFVIASNLSMLTEEVLRFAAEHDIYFSTSLDGPESLHNANRPRPGKNGHALTVFGIQSIQRVLGVDRVSALMTTTERSLPKVRDIIDEYVRRGLHDIFLRPISPYGFAVRTGQHQRYDEAEWLQFYKEGLSYILELNRQGYRLRESMSSIVLQKMLTPQSPGYVDLQSPAGIGISAIVYNYDGDVYASDESRMLAEMGEKRFRLGSLLTDDYETMMLSDTLLDALEASVTVSSPTCTDCAFLPYCGSDPVYHYATQHDIVGNKAFSGFCARNMGIFRHLIELMEDSPLDREVLMRWTT